MRPLNNKTFPIEQTYYRTKTPHGLAEEGSVFGAPQFPSHLHNLNIFLEKRSDGKMIMRFESFILISI